ncbi:hypothetical protein KIN20_033840 [Parelaphostrongylus tenuis]|uniref:MADF domain-containing protein n=1 Tax=Parelaphostrongylus tenuis TaxID=148309 RepID=A0AAD5R8P8_PARTN|nr:hypothetical protein KIN20_033840 [Parelaphostrongylus tenuis]
MMVYATLPMAYPLVRFVGDELAGLLSNEPHLLIFARARQEKKHDLDWVEKHVRGRMPTATVDAKPIATGEVAKEINVNAKSVFHNDMSKDAEIHGKCGEVDDRDVDMALGQYPCTPDDHFEIRLIDAVEKNPCIFNRCHPLHKMSDYKSHVWNQVAQQLSFSGPGVELERKWRHMRDRYVRLRKIDKTSTPLKKGDKWYYYYKKMSFLDPYIEHRNRRKRGDLMTSIMKLGGNVENVFDSPITERNEEEEGSDSAEGEIEDRCDPLKDFYASFAEQSMAMPLPLDVEHCDKQSQPMSTSSKKRKIDENHEEYVADTEWYGCPDLCVSSIGDLSGSVRLSVWRQENELMYISSLRC